VKIAQAPTRNALLDRRDPVAAFIIHGTGQTDLNKCLDLYQDQEKKTCPHYLIATDGVIYQIADDKRVAYHAATPPSEMAIYRMGWQNWSQFEWKNGRPTHLGGEFSGYRQWREQWYDRGYQSPLDLVTKGRVNSLSIGIELQSPVKRTSKIYHPAQYIALAELLNDLAKRHLVGLRRETVLSHSDTNPLRRCTASGPYDPGRDFDYMHLWDLVTAH
jgi:N-acetyl-anhydromuramyl-L-alanine amidase AmpD